jgi:hypothetical protein
MKNWKIEFDKEPWEYPIPGQRFQRHFLWNQKNPLGRVFNSIR